MEYRNAFLGKTERPSDAELAAALGDTAALWSDFVNWMASAEGVAAQEWKGIYVNKYGWSMRLKLKSRNIVYLGPGLGCFMVSFVFSDKALKVAKAARLPKGVALALETAPHYPEGTGLRLIVQKSGDLPAIRKLAAIKVAN
jgi:Protein of unknown function (DUF3788)